MSLEYRNHEYSRNIHLYQADPSTVSDPARLECYDQLAARELERLQEAIEDLTEYRRQVFARLQVVYTAPYTFKISLTRDKRYRDRVYYYLTTEKIFIDEGIKPLVVDRVEYSGSERSKAIADYKAALKAHPGIQCEMNIAKGKWER